MKKLFVFLTAVCVLTGGAFAAGGDASESGVPTSPLKIWSTGGGVGGIYSLGDGGGDVIGKVMWLNAFDFTEAFYLFGEFNWFIVGDNLVNFGLDLGGEYDFMPDSRVAPFFGLGVGGRSFEKADFAVAFTARAGLTMRLTKTADIKLRVPFHFVLNDAKDMGIGVEVGVLFFSSLRKVKSIDY